MLALAAVAIVATALAADYGSRCLRAPLDRSEAITRADSVLARYRQSFGVREDMPLKDASFDPDTKAWLVTYEGPRCAVIIIADRCHGDEVGSTNACTGRKATITSSDDC